MTFVSKLLLRLTVSAALLTMGACGSSSDANAAEDANAGEADDLPLTLVSLDEDGPKNLSGLLEDSELVFEAKLVDVVRGGRYYGPDDEAPDTLAFEQVELVFEPTRIHKGSPGDEVRVLWTAYVTEDRKFGSKRVGRVEVNGLAINEKARGRRFGVFIEETSSEQLYPFTSEGIIPLNRQGEIVARGNGSEALVRGLIGEKLANVIQS